MTSQGRVAVAGSEPRLPDAAAIGELDPGTSLEVTLLVRPRQSLDTLGERPVMSREEFAASYGAAPDDVVNIEAFLRAHGLQVVASSPARRSISVRGTAAAFGEAFGMHIRRYRDASGRTFHAPDGGVSVPAELDGVVQGVFGFDDRPAAREKR